MLYDYRFNGIVSVIGIQELPQQNAAIADLDFDTFEYATTNEGRLVKNKDFNPPSYPENRKPTDPLPSMAQVFPPKKRTYSGKGKALLKHYNNGDWVLTEVQWGNDFSTIGIIGNIKIE